MYSFCLSLRGLLFKESGVLLSPYVSKSGSVSRFRKFTSGRISVPTC